MFLLGRELTGSAAAGLVAGLAFAFAPYRIANIPHLQVLSSAWMPFVLFGLHRHFATGRLKPLAGAAAAWLVQNLSCGYYLLFFTPVVFLYIAWELTRHRMWNDRHALMRIGAAIAIVLAATVPFLLPYVELRRSLKRAASPPTSMPISPPIRTCACGVRSCRYGQGPKDCCFPD